ncbi:VOC family protein [Oricola cellulosilytica]|uniref:Glyoxalase/bleomycin resistance/extradiol dioxygenase family protein n=1 Tax=Oricola cellulosilytica TaxID=1429082 RepID=A0A4R0PGP0_9HYPH|nr:VOC family protein [Oricola cellulosilytica]TCD16063.1 glyoxalase/bleomycin resistance/extradiol dioxygenase family protein [Oricola cellulosilytica]
MALVPDGILETALYVRDLDSAERFYGGTLGLEKIVRVEGRHVFFRCGDGILLLFIASETVRPPSNPALPVPAHGMRGAGHACFRVESDKMEPWRQHLEEEGVGIEADFRWPNGARSIYFRDPAGNSLEIAEPKLWDLE